MSGKIAGKLSFRKEPRETGLSAVGNPYPNTTVKLDGADVGTIYAPNWASKDGKWGVGFMVVDDAPENYGWKWIRLKARFDTEPLARDWIKTNWSALRERYTLRRAES